MADVTVCRVDESDWRLYKQVRLAQLLDAPRAFDTTYEQASQRTDEEWLDLVRTIRIWLALSDGLGIGSVALSRFPEQAPDEDCLIGMWVAPTARGLGVGELLVQTAVDDATARGLARVTLDVADENAPAIGLYERLGFERTGRTGALRHDPSITEVEMARQLR